MTYEKKPTDRPPVSRPAVPNAEGQPRELRRLCSLPRRSHHGTLEEVRWVLAEIHGKKFVSARVWLQEADGSWVPGRQRITVRFTELADVISALERAAGGEPVGEEIWP